MREEKESLTDSFVSFPAVPEKIMERAFSEINKIPTEEAFELDIALNQEFHLYRFADNFSSNFSDSEIILAGSMAAIILFNKLRQMGFPFPLVSKSTLRIFGKQYHSFGKEVHRMVASGFTIEEVTRLILNNTDYRGQNGKYTFPHPDQYRQENPALMDRFLSHGKAAWPGGMLIYELKRMQFFRDQENSGSSKSHTTSLMRGINFLLKKNQNAR